MRRRLFITSCFSLAAAGLSGCVGDDDSTGEMDDDSSGGTGDESDDGTDTGSDDEADDDSGTRLDGYVKPEGDPVAIPPSFQCDGAELERHYTGYEDEDLRFGDFDDFSLRIDDRSYDYGEAAKITLRNTSGQPAETGNRHKYNLELYTDNGWREVRFWTADHPIAYTDEAISHESQEGFEWEMTITEEGIPAASTHQDSLRVCPDLVSGRYRFTYWGVIGDEAIAVEFDLQREE